MADQISKKDIEHLATLARIGVSDEEVSKLQGEFGDILAYVDQLKEIAAEDSGEKKVGEHYDVFRDDVVTCEEGVFTGALLDAAPKRDGQYISVKKILKD